MNSFYFFRFGFHFLLQQLSIVLVLVVFQRLFETEKNRQECFLRSRFVSPSFDFFSFFNDRFFLVFPTMTVKSSRTNRRENQLHRLFFVAVFRRFGHGELNFCVFQIHFLLLLFALLRRFSGTLFGLLLEKRRGRIVNRRIAFLQNRVTTKKFFLHVVGPFLNDRLETSKTNGRKKKNLSVVVFGFIVRIVFNVAAVTGDD